MQATSSALSAALASYAHVLPHTDSVTLTAALYAQHQRGNLPTHDISDYAAACAIAYYALAYYDAPPPAPAPQPMHTRILRYTRRILRRIAQHFGTPAPLCTCTTCRDIIATRNR